MGLKVKLGTRVFPWEDLLTPDFPSPFLTLGDGEDIEFVLAVMSGMGPTVPKMLQLDANGRLLIGVQSPLAQVGIGDVPFPGFGARVVPAQDALTGTAINGVVSQAFGYLFNGATEERLRSASAANLAAQAGPGIGLSSPPGMWSVVSTPAAGVQATATKAAGAAGVRHICTAILVTFGAIAAPVATQGQWVLRDGATGAGTILMSGQLAIPAAVFQGQPVFISDLSIPGTGATAMTLEFTAALANLIQGVTLLGFDAS